jgi:putative ATP-dependent endonuclease of the OLD family
MQIRRLILSNFRGVKRGQIKFDGHTILIGGNSVGKSTVCEALDLLLGPDRLLRSNAINEHDFHRRTYIDELGEPVKISLEVVLTDLSSELDKKYRAHREYWDTEKQTLLDEDDEPEETELDHVIPALRVAFEGQYDKEEDEFTAQTYFASPPPDEGENRARVSAASKREFGLIYLSTCATDRGARAKPRTRLSARHHPPPQRR